MKKPIKCGAHSGNTFRFGSIPIKYRACEKSSELLTKHITYTNIDEKFDRSKIVSLYSEIINDGELTRKICNHKNSKNLKWDLATVEMSLNKHKRWLLPELLKNAVDEMSDKMNEEDQERNADYRLSFSEHSRLSMMRTPGRGGFVPDCTGYHDSGAKRRHVVPRRVYGRIEGLKEAARGEKEMLAEKLKRVKRERRLVKRCHDRGVQRLKQKMSWREVEKNIRKEAEEEQIQNVTPRVEVHYQITHRRPLMAHKDCSDSGHFSRYPWSYLFSHPQKAIKKVNSHNLKHGTRSGACKNSRKEISLQCEELDVELCQLKGRSVPINNYQSMDCDPWSDSEESVKDFEDEKCRTLDWDLSDFIVKKADKSQRKRKAEMKVKNTSEKKGPSCIEDLVEVSCNSASRLGKGEMVYEEKPCDYLKQLKENEEHVVKILTTKAPIRRRRRRVNQPFIVKFIPYALEKEERDAMPPQISSPVVEIEDRDIENTFTIIENTPELSEFVLPVDFVKSSIGPCVSLAKESASAENLRTVYGVQYEEGFCLPRKFAIDITREIEGENFVIVDKDGKVENEMDKENLCSRTVVLFEETQAENNELQHFRISFAELPFDLEPQEEKILENFSELNNTMNMNDLIENLQSRITSMKSDDRLGQSVVKSNSDMSDVSISRQSFSFIRQVLQPDQSLHSYSRHLALHHASQRHVHGEQMSTQQQKTSTASCVTTPEEYCDICMAPTNKILPEDSNTCPNPAALNSDISQGLALIPCLHNFCMQCWRRYLLQQICERSLCIKCPGSSCMVELSRVVMSAILPRSYMNKFDEYCAETFIEKNRKEWSFCNNVKCNRVTRVSAKKGESSIYVQCSCRSQWCIDCYSAPHWPSTCQQSKLYSSILSRRGDQRKLAVQEVLRVEYKTCPRCNYPIEKNGGCDHMTCRKCGENFCWKCGLLMTEHANGCLNTRVENRVVEFHQHDFSETLEVVYFKTVQHRHWRVRWSPDNVKKWILLKIEGILKLTADETRISRRPRKRSALLRINYLENFDSLLRIISGVETQIPQNSDSVQELAFTLWSAALLYIDARYALEYSSAKLLSAVTFSAKTRHNLMKHLSNTITTFSLFTDELEQDLLGRWEQSNVHSVREHIDNMNSRIERGKQLIKQLSARSTSFDQLLAAAAARKSN